MAIGVNDDQKIIEGFGALIDATDRAWIEVRDVPSFRSRVALLGAETLSDATKGLGSPSHYHTLEKLGDNNPYALRTLAKFITEAGFNEKKPPIDGGPPHGRIFQISREIVDFSARWPGDI